MSSVLAVLKKPIDRIRQRFDRPASQETSRKTIVISTLAVAAFVMGLIMLIALGPHGVPGAPYYNVNAEFRDVAQITPLSEVRMLGRRVGQVTKVDFANGHPMLRLQLRPGEPPLRSDTTARIRLKGILGGRFVELVPGLHGRPLPNNSTLGLRQTSTTVELLDVFQTFDPLRRQETRSTVQGLGAGFYGRSRDINETLRTAPGLVRDLDTVSGAVLHRRGAAQRFFPSAESLAQAYDPVREDLARGFDPQARALGAFADERASLRATLDTAPPTLSALRRGLDASSPLLDETAGLARATTRLTRPAPASFHDATILLRDARPALLRTQPLLQATQRAVAPTLSFLERTDPEIGPTIRVLNSNIPPLREFARRRCDYLAFGRQWRSGLGFGVPPGPVDRQGLDNTYPGVGNVLNSFRVTTKAPTESESLLADNPRRGVGVPIAKDPYPAPCVAATERLRSR